MDLLKRQFSQVWDQLRGKKSQYKNYLEEVRIQGLRGISDLKVSFNFPVSVLAGPNACGKSTILYALATGYKLPESTTEGKARDFFPATIFPNFQCSDDTNPSDKKTAASLEFYYIDNGQRKRMKWSRGTKGWNKSFFGEKWSKQPQRTVYLRTLSNLTNPSDVRSVLQLAMRPFTKEDITADLLNFAHRILPLHYRHLIIISHKGKNLLFAQRDDGNAPSYSEFHMSAGERSILWLSKDISKIQNGLILIDEIEAGLHPYTQQQTMLELQRLALRNNLQIVVTTHSPIILETVPPEARIFLERLQDNVITLPPYRDIIQNAMWGVSIDKLSILCEDEVAEGIIRGVLDVINPKLNLRPSDYKVGRDTGKQEFPNHVRTLAKFKELEDFIFVLDGDAHDIEADVKQAARESGQLIQLLFLPGDKAPETWVWEQIKNNLSYYSRYFSMEENAFKQMFENIERSYESSTDTPRNIAKGRLFTFANQLSRELSILSREVGRTEATLPNSSLLSFIEELEHAINSWRGE